MMNKRTEHVIWTRDENLPSVWYIYLNLRELGSQYEGLGLLGGNIDGFWTLRWHGIAVERLSDCPVCGDGVKNLAIRSGVEIYFGDVEAITKARRKTTR